jgi:voltage-gated potassium channel
MTQYTITYQAKSPTTVGAIFLSLKKQYSATLIAVKNPDSEILLINPGLDTKIKSDAMIYYIADERITELSWSNISRPVNL